MKLRRLIAPAAGVLVALVGSLAAPGSGAAVAKAAAQPRVFTVLAGDSTYLIYRVSRSPQGRMSVYVRTRHGHPRLLISGTSLFTRSLSVSLVGSTLTADEGAFVQGAGVDTTHVYWWRLDAHTSGVLPVGRNQPWLGTVPNGFLLDNLDSHFNTTGHSIEKLDGSASPLNVPFSNDNSVQPGPKGLFSYDGFHHLEYAAYGSDTVRRLKDPVGTRDPEWVGCGLLTERYLQCSDNYDGDGGKPFTYLFVPLDGGQVIAINGARSLDAIAVGTQIAYRRHGKVIFRSSTGKRTVSRSTERPVGAAFGGLITANHTSTRIELVTNAKARPVTLLHD